MTYSSFSSRAKHGICLSFALFLGACWHGNLPPQEYYRLRLAEKTDSIAGVERDVNAPTLPAGGIAILPYVTPGLYGDRAIVFRVDDAQYGSYPNRAWAIPIQTMLGLMTEDLFRGHPLTRDPAVFDPPSPHAYAYVWRGLVRELEEVDRGKHVYAAVRLDARLVRARDDSVIWSGSARLERAVPEGTMPAIVTALSQLAIDVVGELQESARASIAGPAASAVRTPPTARNSRP